MHGVSCVYCIHCLQSLTQDKTIRQFLLGFRGEIVIKNMQACNEGAPNREAPTNPYIRGGKGTADRDALALLVEFR